MLADGERDGPDLVDTVSDATLHVAAGAFTGCSNAPFAAAEAERALELCCKHLELVVGAFQSAAISAVFRVVALCDDLSDPGTVLRFRLGIERDTRVASINHGVERRRQPTTNCAENV